MGFGEPVQQRIKSMKIIDLNKENAQDHEADKTFSKDRLHVHEPGTHLPHMAGDRHARCILPQRAFNGNGTNQTGTLILFQKRNHLNI